MIAVMVEFLLEALGALLRGTVRLLGNMVGHVVIEAPASMTGSRRDRRRARRRLRQLARDGHTDELVRAYRRLGRSEAARDLRIDALRLLATSDARAAEPVLREVLTGPEDAWVMIGALDAVARGRILTLRDTVAATERDPRPAVSAYATDVRKRLDRRRKRLDPTTA